MADLKDLRKQLEAVRQETENEQVPEKTERKISKKKLNKKKPIPIENPIPAVQPTKEISKNPVDKNPDQKTSSAVRKKPRKKSIPVQKTESNLQSAFKEALQKAGPIKTQSAKKSEKVKNLKASAAPKEERSEDNGPLRNIPGTLELNPALPVTERAEEIKEAIQNNQVVIISGETGSGKTTQLPKICLQLGRGSTGLIGHTQPRRIAATSIAKRIAEETQSEPGMVAGYKIRFKDNIQEGASIKLMTDGILLAETQSDPLLKAYDTIIIDEAHERSLNIDFLLGYLREILPKRPDLKLIVTSATIDSERFAKHFEGVNGKPVPVINVSGRLYPVQIRYRPIQDEDENDDRTLMQAISDACDELMIAGSGDILVFLPGEREIREAAETLRKNNPRNVTILPLFSRLSNEDQERIFRVSGTRRIILSTNIAETSLTVPGIRFVVDSGLARVKRYSYRNKVEQLQIEKISQASAAQRAGRCGRVADGICIRLYSQEDFERRPKFSDPEILRSSLATVILRMKALHLSDIRNFPFVEAPPPRAINDGYDLLIELNAVNSRNGELTRVGRELAKLPLDAKVARMLLAGHENLALEEVLIIASALSVQDPRERPLEAQQAADQAHRKFADTKSDFLSWIKLWNFMQDRIEHKESNRLLELEFKKNFLSARKLREWRDVYRQLRDMVKEMGFRFNGKPATYEQLHKALMTGLLGNLGCRSLDADYKTPPFIGARGIKFWVWPGSFLAKKAGKWIMAAEIVETTRLYARTIADIEPEWAEHVGAHLLKKSWTEPHWEKSRGQVVAFEKGTLYGLPVYGQRRVDFAPHDPKLARELFIREALVQGDVEIKAPFWQHNQRLINEIKDIEHKSRRPDVLVDDQLLFDFYDSKLDETVCSLVTLETWRKLNEKADPKILFLEKKDLMRHDAEGVTIEYFPKKISIGGVDCLLKYHFEPGSPRDGVTVTVPLFLLNQIDEERMEWLVPGMVKEKVQFLLKSLPQRYRRYFIPLQDWAKKFAEGHERPEGNFYEAVIDDARKDFRIDLKKTDFKLENLPAHLFMNYKVVDEHNRQIGMSRSLPQLKTEFGTQAREFFMDIAVKNAKSSDELQEKYTDWTFGELPEIMEIHRKGASLIGHPAVVDNDTFCTIEVFDDPEQAMRVNRDGIRRLIRFQLKEQIRYLEKSLNTLQTTQIQGSVIPFFGTNFESFEDVKNAIIDAALNLVISEGELPKNEEEFRELCRQIKTKLNLLGGELGRLLTSIVQEAGVIQKKIKTISIYKEVEKDIKNQLEDLFPKNFIKTVPLNYLKHYPRYLKAIGVRIDKIRSNPQRDFDRMNDIQELTINWKKELIKRKGVPDKRLEEFSNLLQELRVSLFAQELRTPMPVSVKRLNKVWQSIIYT